jgi:PAS domain S-box-containing protein
MTSEHKGTGVLIVDDTEENLRVLVSLVEGMGYNARAVTNGDMALKAASASPPDLILLDIRMPEMDGFEVCQKLKQNKTTSGIPVIFISALHDTADKVRAFEAGGADFVTKPFNHDEVKARIGTHLALKKITRELEKKNNLLTQEMNQRRQLALDLQKFNYELENKVRQRTFQLNAFKELAQQIAATLSLDQFLSIVGRRMLELMEADLALVYLLEESSLAHGDTTASNGMLHESPAHKQIGECLCGIVADTGEPAFSSDIHNDARCTLTECKKAGITSFAAIPLKVQEDILGVLGIASLKRRDFSRQRDFLLTLSTQIALGLKKALQHKHILRQAEELEIRYLELERAQNELRVSEERFRAISESANDLIFVKDRNLRYLHVNKAMKFFYNLEITDVNNLDDERLFGREESDYVKQLEHRVIKGQSIEEERTRILNGQELIFSETRAPLRDSKGLIVGLCGISREITDRRSKPVAGTQPSEYPSESMRKTMKLANQAAATDSCVLLQGESGSGKDHLAQRIHSRSKRAAGPYFVLNCAAISHTLAEAELFGHERGAFTSAQRSKRGLLELSEGGTLFLNEIGELPLAIQSKLLTFLDTKSFLRIGGEKHVQVDARIIAASNRDLQNMSDEGLFLLPLFYRLNVINIRVPALRERREDIPIIARELLSKLSLELFQEERPSMTEMDSISLMNYHWPGNVRELRNILERWLIVGGRIASHLLDQNPARDEDERANALPLKKTENLKEALDDLTTHMCIEALRKSDGNKREAAKLLGIPRKSLYRIIERLKLDAIPPSKIPN